MTERRARWRKIALAVCLLASSVPLAIATFDADFPDSASAGAAIVLGAAIYGNRPSPVFAARLDYARDLMRTRRVQWVIVTGGFGEGERRSEAEVGKQYLASLGVDPNRVLVENRSRTTFENYFYARRLVFGGERC